MMTDGRFTPVSGKVLKQVVRDCFSREAKLDAYSLVKGGVSNTSYVLRLAGERTKYIVRFAPVRKEHLFEYEKTMLANEPIIYRRMAERGIPVPSFIRHDDTFRSINREYSVTEYIEDCVEHSELSAEMKADVQVQLGKWMAVMHDIRHFAFGWPTSDGTVRGSRSWAETLLSFTDEICSRNAALGLVDDPDLARFADFMQRSRGILDRIIQPSLVHNDIWEPNILVKRVGEKAVIAALIDVERAMYADPEYENALCWGGRHLMNGYGKSLDNSTEGRKRRQIYRMIYDFYMVHTWKVHSGDGVQSDACKNAALAALSQLEANM